MGRSFNVCIASSVFSENSLAPLNSSCSIVFYGSFGMLEACNQEESLVEMAIAIKCDMISDSLVAAWKNA